MSRRESTSEEAAPFLYDPRAEVASKEFTELAPAKSPRCRLGAERDAASTAILLFNVFLLLVNAGWSIINLQSNSAATNLAQRLYGGLYEASGAPIRLQIQTWELPIGKRSPFTDLDPAVADAAWSTINMGGKQGWISESKKKIDLMNQSSIEFSDGSGYLFGIDVFHQLHCLDFLRKKTVLYNPYYPVVEEDEDIPVPYHIAHCIDSIRLSLQCHADLTLIPQRWAEGWIEPWAIWTNQHQCRNFDVILDWARRDMPLIGDTLVHPQLGVFYSKPLNHSALPIYQEPHDELPDS